MRSEGRTRDARVSVVVAAMICGSGCLCEQFVTVSNGDVTRLTVCVDVSDEPDEREMGLRGRDPLAVHEGMLLVFPREGEICLTNEGVMFAIDALFVDDNGTVTQRARLASDDATRVCAPLTRQVLELAEGVAREVVAGDTMTRADNTESP